MNKKFLIIYYILMAIFGGILGKELAKRDHKIEQLQKENAEIKDENNYLEWQLGEVPTIIESRKGEICSE